VDKQKQVLSELKKTVGYIKENGWSNNRTAVGYHSIETQGVSIIAQRRPKLRLDKYREYIDFKNKKVIDFGCNIGGMLIHLGEIKEGIGYDFDRNCINAANNISKILNQENKKYHTFNFDTEDYKNLKKFNPDIVFLLSLGSWIKKWKKLYQYCIDLNCYIVLEINNTKEGEEQIQFFKSHNLNVTLIVDNSLDDTTNNNRRKTYLIK